MGVYCSDRGRAPVEYAAKLIRTLTEFKDKEALSHHSQ